MSTQTPEPDDLRVPLDAFLDIAVRIPRLHPHPPLDGRLTGWPATALLPDLSALHDQHGFGRVLAGWSVDGLALAFDVRASHPLWVDPQYPARSDGVEIWCDTRDSRQARRLTPFCHHFRILPILHQPHVREVREGDAGQPVPAVRAGVRIQPGHGYGLEVFLPREALRGYAPLESASLGLGYRIRGSRGGLQDLAFGERFPIWHNPSLWRSVQLEGAGERGA